MGAFQSEATLGSCDEKRRASVSSRSPGRHPTQALLKHHPATTSQVTPLGTANPRAVVLTALARSGDAQLASPAEKLPVVPSPSSIEQRGLGSPRQTASTRTRSWPQGIDRVSVPSAGWVEE